VNACRTDGVLCLRRAQTWVAATGSEFRLWSGSARCVPTVVLLYMSVSAQGLRSVAQGEYAAGGLPLSFSCNHQGAGHLPDLPGDVGDAPVSASSAPQNGLLQRDPPRQGNRNARKPLPRRWEINASRHYALARRRASDQYDSAVSTMSALDAAGSSEASASI
jgi:hypothetical protein